MIVVLAFFMYNPRYSAQTSKQWQDLLRFFPQCVAILPETAAELEKVNKTKTKHIIDKHLNFIKILIIRLCANYDLSFLMLKK